MILETERILLRQFDLSDVDTMYAINCDPEVTRYTHDGGVQPREEIEKRLAGVIRDYEEHGYGRWAVVHKPDQQLIGFAGLKYLSDLEEVDIGYRFASAYWGRGLATEVSIALVDYGFNVLKLDRIIGMALVENTASIRVLEKAGLAFEKYITEEGAKGVYHAINRDSYERQSP